MSHSEYLASAFVRSRTSDHKNIYVCSTRLIQSCEKLELIDKGLYRVSLPAGDYNISYVFQHQEEKRTLTKHFVMEYDVEDGELKDVYIDVQSESGHENIIVSYVHWSALGRDWCLGRWYTEPSGRQYWQYYDTFVKLYRDNKGKWYTEYNNKRFYPDEDLFSGPDVKALISEREI
jgi:hypothetical protein